jgi:RHH-type proline utilization regulon transcriptional repressor/proline dehydrogenase/delta 1-pyrroline-5-carboxylate dehydrogenase
MRIDPNELDRLTRLYGEELFARIDARGPFPLSPSWWDGRLMDWSMRDEAIKLQLFRFIDALPLLQKPEDVSRHLKEYFAEAGSHISPLVRGMVRWLPSNGRGAKWLSAAAFRSSDRMARRFIAGATLEETLRAIAAQRHRKLAFTIDLLGEASLTEAEADRYQAEYLHLVDGLTTAVNEWPAVDEIDRDAYGPLPRVNVSIKLSSLYSQFDPIDPEGTSRAVKDRLRPILHLARRRRAFVNLDMEQFSYKDLTIRIFEELLDEDDFRDWPDVGIALQAYLRSAERDVCGLAEWAKRRGTPVWVRLIKGAYWDYETVVAAQEGWPVPVWTRKWQSDATYEKLSIFLLENHRTLRPAFGSHNVRSLAHAMAAAQLMGLPPGSYEIQMLYGMADPMKHALVRLEQRVRVYTPFGQLLPGMAYLVRRLLENTANTSFLRASFSENVPEEKLLMNPALLADPLLDAEEPSDDGEFHNEPLTDFSQEAGRGAMAAALAQVKKQLGGEYPPIIEGRAVEASQWIESVNPSHQREIVGRCRRASVAQATEAIAAAARALPAWRDTDPERRAQYLEAAAEVLRRRRFELAAWEVYECAKQWREADADVAEAIDFCVYYAREMRRLAEPQRVDLPGEENATIYDPRGVCVVIAPWNFPLAILAGMTTAALVTGNTVIMKPAEQSSVVAAKLMEVFQEIGLPPGAVSYLPGVGEEIGPTLAEHPDVALIAFTGSRGVGVALSRQAAALAAGQTHIKRLIAELGGKNAIIVDDDADLDEAVAGVVTSAFVYQGQKCSACSRAIVLEPLYDKFFGRLVEATRSLKIGPAEDPGCKVGPVIDADARDRILGFIEKGKQEAKLAFAGDLGFLLNEGFYVAPHIFADVPPTASIAQEEIFGPVLSVLKARDLTHALEIANGTSYALTGGFFSRSPDNIRRAKREFRVGNLYINRKITGALVHRQPFGGFKLSGIGSKAGGPDYLLQFMIPRTITENTMRRGFAPSEQGIQNVR